MALDGNALVATMTQAAAGAFGQGWKDVRNYTVPELRKLAGTFVDIEQGLTARPPYYTRESADIIFRMQVRATQSVLTATTALTLIVVERAINEILAAVRTMTNQAIGFALL
ncbi:MAG: hypothetical protein AUI57_07325 [Candidatus Rokubacteria bacterium 13_1_40CM_2_68_8]|jgi:hypothetical protein|nr:MAG: hypothetical protein AUI57_07325 [Candidatus Rokubacteria bacterium 13_1_40CM_2_68_8]PYN20002.1 MAG: hypothetical protein DMD99_24150 [Candidatus Rokubacteria bacterium]